MIYNIFISSLIFFGDAAQSEDEYSKIESLARSEKEEYSEISSTFKTIKRKINASKNLIKNADELRLCQILKESNSNINNRHIISNCLLIYAISSNSSLNFSRQILYSLNNVKSYSVLNEYLMIASSKGHVDNLSHEIESLLLEAKGDSRDLLFLGSCRDILNNIEKNNSSELWLKLIGELSKYHNKSPLSIEYQAKYLIYRNFLLNGFPPERYGFSKDDSFVVLLQNIKRSNNKSTFLTSEALNEINTCSDRLMCCRILLDNTHDALIYRDLIAKFKASDKMYLEVVLNDYIEKITDTNINNKFLIELLSDRSFESTNNLISIKIKESKKMTKDLFLTYGETLIKNKLPVNFLPQISCHYDDVLNDQSCVNLLARLVDYKLIGDKKIADYNARLYLYSALGRSSHWQGNHKVLVDEFYNRGGAIVIPALMNLSHYDDDTKKCFNEVISNEKFYKSNFRINILEGNHVEIGHSLNCPIAHHLISELNERGIFDKLSLEKAKVIIDKYLKNPVNEEKTKQYKISHEKITGMLKDIK